MGDMCPTTPHTAGRAQRPGARPHVSAKTCEAPECPLLCVWVLCDSRVLAPTFCSAPVGLTLTPVVLSASFEHLICPGRVGMDAGTKE